MVFPNNDEMYYTDVVYEINEYEGELKQDAESKELVWVTIDKLPANPNCIYTKIYKCNNKVKCSK